MAENAAFYIDDDVSSKGCNDLLSIMVLGLHESETERGPEYLYPCIFDYMNLKQNEAQQYLYSCVFDYMICDQL